MITVQAILTTITTGTAFTTGTATGTTTALFFFAPTTLLFAPTPFLCLVFSRLLRLRPLLLFFFPAKQMRSAGEIVCM